MRVVWIVEGRVQGAWVLAKLAATQTDAKRFSLAAETSYDAVRIVKYVRVEEGRE